MCGMPSVLTWRKILVLPESLDRIDFGLKAYSRPLGIICFTTSGRPKYSPFKPAALPHSEPLPAAGTKHIKTESTSHIPLNPLGNEAETPVVLVSLIISVAGLATGQGFDMF